MKDVTTAVPLVEALAREVADACAALLGATTAATRVEAGGEAGWTATIACSGGLDGIITLGLSEADGRRLSGLVMGMDDSPDEAVVDTVREVCSQAVGSLSQQDVARGLVLAVTDARRTAGTAHSPEAHAAFEFALPDGVTPRLFVHAELVVAEPRVVTAASAATRGPEPERTTPEPAAPSAAAAPNLDVLLDVELPIAVRFGQTELPLLSLVRLGPGAVIDLRRSADEPVEVLVSGKVIARGEVVVVDGNYGVRVTEIVSTAERIRSMGA